MQITDLNEPIEMNESKVWENWENKKQGLNQSKSNKSKIQAETVDQLGNRSLTISLSPDKPICSFDSLAL